MIPSHYDNWANTLMPNQWAYTKSAFNQQMHFLNLFETLKKQQKINKNQKIKKKNYLVE